MTFPEKLEILIRRKGITKTEVAKSAGITYRGLANYIAGGRKPRVAVLAKIAQALDTTPEFLISDKQGIVLSSEERFIFNAASPEQAVSSALLLLEDVKRVFSGDLTAADKQALYSCMSEIYFASKK
jgi:transcriptional regulator with XRE-family HTH domain